MATPPPPAVRPGEGAAARALTSLSSWLAWVKRGAYKWLASAALRLSSWREGASASTAAKASGEEAINKPSGKKGIKKPLRTKRSNGDFPVDVRPQRRHHDDYDLVQPQLYSRSFAADRKSPRVDPSENRDKIMHLFFKEANEKCKKNHTLCLACFMANFGSKSPVRPRDIHNDNMQSHYDRCHGRGSTKCSSTGCHVRAKNKGDIGRHRSLSSLEIHWIF